MLACVQTLPPLKRKSRRGGVCIQAQACRLNKLFGVHIYHFFLGWGGGGGGGGEAGKGQKWLNGSFAILPQG